MPVWTECPALLPLCGFPLLDGPDTGGNLLFAVAPAEGVIVFGNRFQSSVFLLHPVKRGIQRSISLLEPAVISFETLEAMLEVKIFVIKQ